MPYMPLVSEKLEVFDLHKDEYDAIFIGSSRIYRQVSPSLFDRVMRDRGHNIHSFNFGLFGMKLPETYFWLAHVLSKHPQKLQWVFIEANLNNAYEPLANARTNRVMYWHTFPQTLATLKYVFAAKDTLPRKAITACSHLLPFLYQTLNIGVFSSSASPYPNLNKASASERYNAFLGQQMDGYKPLDEETATAYLNPRKDFLDNLEKYKANVDSFQEQSKKQHSIDSGSKELIGKFSAIVQQFGAAPIFVIPPKLENEATVTELYSKRFINQLLAFNSPRKYPTLYEPGYRFDEKHLNDSGAKVFTRLLAAEFDGKNRHNKAR